MSCGHDGCTCGPTTNDPTTSLPTLEPQDGEDHDGCCGGHDHSASGHGCHHDGQPV